MINTIEIPDRFVAVAGRWYDGMGDMLYAISSTGGLTIGTTCPVRNFTDLDDRNIKWYYSIWVELSCDVGHAASTAELAVEDHTGEGDWDHVEYEELCEDSRLLNEFEAWVDLTVEAIIVKYPTLADWDEPGDLLDDA